MKAPIHSVKHFVQWQGIGVASGAINNLTFAHSVVIQNVDLNTEVVEGAVIKAVYIEVWTTSDDAVQGASTVTIEKRPAGATAMTITQSNALHGYANKKNILHTPNVTRYL